ncbi:heme b synthase [Desulfuribacillus alkaliarsenatis]
MNQMAHGDVNDYMKNIGHKLRLIFWELTEGCNLKCIHCRATAQPERNTQELSTEECFRIIDELVKFSNPIVILTGGEPLYRPDFFEIAQYGTDKGLRIAMASNGTMITKEIAQKIKDVGVQRVSISFDGANPETHDGFRGIPGSFNEALQGARNLREIGVEVQFNTTITKHNVHEVEEIMDLTIREGAIALHTFMLVPVGCGVEISDNAMLPSDEYEKVLEWFYQKSKEVPIELKATCAPHYFRIMRQKAKEEGIEITPKTHGMAAMTKGCLAGTGVCFLSHKGRVQPCGYLPVQAGDATKQTMQEIWEGSDIFTQLRDNANLKGKCGICDYKNVCEGCRARAFAVTGDFLDQEPSCNYIPRKIQK